MLRYDIKLNNNNTTKYIDIYGDLKLARNGDFIFGRTKDNIINGQNIIVEIGDGIENTKLQKTSLKLPIKVNKKHYSGYFKFHNSVFPIKAEYIISFDNDGSIKENTNAYQVDIDDVFIDYGYEKNDLGEEKLVLYKTSANYPNEPDYLEPHFYHGVVFFNGDEYDCWQKININSDTGNLDWNTNNKVFILTEKIFDKISGFIENEKLVFIEDNKVIFNDDEYIVSYDKDNKPYIMINTIEGIKKIYGTKEDVILNEFWIYKEKNEYVTTDRFSYVTKHKYINYNGNSYYSDSNGKIKINNKEYKIEQSKENITSDWDGDIDFEQTIINEYVVIDGIQYNTKFNWVETKTQTDELLIVLSGNDAKLLNNEWFVVSNNGTDYNLPLIEVIGTNSYICDVSKVNSNLLENKYNNIFSINKNSFSLNCNLLKTDTTTPYDIYWYNTIKNSIRIKNSSVGYNIPLNIWNNTSVDADKDRLIVDEFIPSIASDTINSFVDMEHDIYYPQFIGNYTYITTKVGNDEYQYKVSISNKVGYVSINGVDFKLNRKMKVTYNDKECEIKQKYNGDYYIVTDGTQKDVEIKEKSYIERNGKKKYVSKTDDVVIFTTFVMDEEYSLYETNNEFKTSFFKGLFKKTKVSYSLNESGILGFVENKNGTLNGYVSDEKIGVKANNIGYYTEIGDKIYTSKADKKEYINEEKEHYFIIPNEENNEEKFYVQNEKVAVIDGNEYIINDGEYYVVFYGENCDLKYGKTTTLIEEIKFYLHFLNNSVNNRVLNGEKEWNIFNTDYYTNSYKMLNSGIDNDYFQPSDLLGLIGFEYDDVYFQRSNISKSFLRLMFFDSKDPNKQNLLHTSTIFLDENKLFSKCINDDLNVSKENVINKRQKNSIGINSEPLDGKSYSFDEKYRLSSEITVNNKYTTNNSSDGFYLYLFKDYLGDEKVKEIYLKIQFNHAGIGRTFNMVFPYGYDSKSNPRQFDFSGKYDKYIDRGDVFDDYVLDNGDKKQLNDDFNEFKNGLSVLDKLNDKLYLPIKITYNENINKYVYYLPEGFYPSSDYRTMKFNLYEPKIKNESNLFNNHDKN